MGREALGWKGWSLGHTHSQTHTHTHTLGASWALTLLGSLGHTHTHTHTSMRAHTHTEAERGHVPCAGGLTGHVTLLSAVHGVGTGSHPPSHQRGPLGRLYRPLLGPAGVPLAHSLVNSPCQWLHCSHPAFIKEGHRREREREREREGQTIFTPG
jgi:hypothetical protein